MSAILPQFNDQKNANKKAKQDDRKLAEALECLCEFFLVVSRAVDAHLDVVEGGKTHEEG